MKYLNWDSEFFGIDSYFIDKPYYDELPKGFITAKIDINEVKYINYLLQNGFYFVLNEIVLECKDFNISSYDIKIKEIDSLAIDYNFFTQTRFHLDKNLKEKADLLWNNYLKTFKNKPNRHILVALDNQKIIGIFLFEKIDFIYLSFVYIDENYRNKGIGKALMNEIKKYKLKIITGTQLQNPALNFYLKNKFLIKQSNVVLHRFIRN